MIDGLDAFYVREAAFGCYCIENYNLNEIRILSVCARKLLVVGCKNWGVSKLPDRVELRGELI